LGKSEEYAQQSNWIVRLENAWVDLTPAVPNVCFLFEALSHGSMFRVRELSSNGGFIPEPALAAIITQVLLGLGDLERAHRVHRSIQPSHILLDASGCVRIAGFGFSKKLRTSTTLADTFVGFSEYMAPERVSFSGTHSLVSDIWSLGICALEWVLLESAWAPFTPSTMDPMAMVNLIADASPAGLEMLAMRDDVSQECKDFIQGCLVTSPAERLTVGELLVCIFLHQFSQHPCAFICSFVHLFICSFVHLFIVWWCIFRNPHGYSQLQMI
jgi:serine/threonine protein kinase